MSREDVFDAMLHWKLLRDAGVKGSGSASASDGRWDRYEIDGPADGPQGGRDADYYYGSAPPGGDPYDTISGGYSGYSYGPEPFNGGWATYPWSYYSYCGCSYSMLGLVRPRGTPPTPSHTIGSPEMMMSMQSEGSSEALLASWSENGNVVYDGQPLSVEVSSPLVVSPSTLFQSSHAGGPSFDAYAAPSESATFDAAGRLTSFTDRNQAVTRFAYDGIGNLTSLTDPVGNATTWSYDAQNRVSSETDQLGISRYFGYNEAGGLARYTDRNGRVRQYGYDDAGNVASETWYSSAEDADNAANPSPESPAPSPVNTIAYERDAAGRIVSETDNISSVIYVYNDAGQITSTTQSSVGGPTVTIEYQYDTGGHRTQMAATIDGAADFVDDYTYDDLGRIVSVTEHGVEGGNAVAEKEIDLTYNDSGQLVSIDRYQDGQLAVEGDYSYDSVGRLTGLVYHQGENVLNSYAWTYSDSGRFPNSIATAGRGFLEENLTGSWKPKARAGAVVE